MNHEPCDCQTALDNLYRFIDHEIDEATDEQIQAHLGTCTHCISEFDMERMVKLLVGRSCSEVAPGELRERVRLTIRTYSVEYRSPDAL